MNQVARLGRRPPPARFSVAARFPRRARLRHKTDFERVRSLGQLWRHPLFALAVCRNGQDFSRVGIVAGKKIGQAVARNRARRLLREAARLLYGEIAPGWDIVLIAHPAIGQAKTQHVHSALAGLARQAGLLKVES